MGKRVKLTEWSAGRIGDGDGHLRLSGRVEGHPKKEDGTVVVTSYLTHSLGRDCYTASGNVYELVGDPEPDFLEFLKNNGLTYDAKHPVKVRR